MFKVLIALLLLATPVFADPTPEGSLPMEIGTTTPSEEPATVKLTNIDPPNWVEKFPPIKNTLLYSMRDSELRYASMFETLKWKGLSVDVGYSPSDAIVGALSYDFFTLEKFGVEIPIIKHIGLQPSVYYSMRRLGVADLSDSEEDWGFSLNVVSLRFL